MCRESPSANVCLASRHSHTGPYGFRHVVPLNNPVPFVSDPVCDCATVAPKSRSDSLTKTGTRCMTCGAPDAWEWRLFPTTGQLRDVGALVYQRFVYACVRPLLGLAPILVVTFSYLPGCHNNVSFWL